MAFWDGLWPRREAQFESGNAATNSIVLSKRHATVSLTKQGALTGNLRVNLSWRMRTSDIEGRSRQSGRLLRPFKLFQPDVVQAHTQGVVNVDLDLGCMYELKDGTKGVVQPLGNLIGDLNGPPYIRLSGDDRFGAPSGETVYVNLDQREQIKRLLFFVYIYDQTAGLRPYARQGDALPGQRAADRDRARREGPAGPLVRRVHRGERQGRADRAARGEIRLRLPVGAGPAVRLGDAVGPRLQVTGLRPPVLDIPGSETWVPVVGPG